MCEEGKTGVCVFEGGSTLSNARIQSVVRGVSSRGGMEVKIMEIRGKRKYIQGIQECAVKERPQTDFLYGMSGAGIEGGRV